MLVSSFKRSNFVSIFVCFLIFVFALLTRLYYIEKKKGLHMDEVMTVMISNYSPVWHETFYKNAAGKPVSILGEENSGKAIKDMAFKDSYDDALACIKKLYLDNRDRPHTNLYYSCFRLCLVGTSTVDRGEIIKRGCALNVLFFIFSFFFFYKLARRLFSKDYLVYLALVVAFFNTGSISNTLFLRPYQLQETLLILFTYIFSKYFYGRKSSVSFVLVTALTLLSGYYAAIYVLMIYGILAFLNRKKKTELKNLFFTFLGAIGLARLLFRGFFHGFTCGRAVEGYQYFCDYKLFLQNLIFSVECFFDILGTYLFYPTVFCIILVLAYGVLKSSKIKLPLIIFCTAFIWAAGNIFLAPFKELRYIMSCFPLLTLIIPYGVSVESFNFKKVWRYFGAAVVSIIFVFSAYTKKVQNLFTDQTLIPTKLETKLPVIIRYTALSFEILPWLKNDKVYNLVLTDLALREKLDILGEALLIFSTFDEVAIFKALSAQYEILEKQYVTSLVLCRVCRRQG